MRGCSDGQQVRCRSPVEIGPYLPVSGVGRGGTIVLMPFYVYVVGLQFRVGLSENRRPGTRVGPSTSAGCCCWRIASQHGPCST